MKYAKLGRSGLEVSRLCVGCLSYGAPMRGTHAWTLAPEPSTELIKAALDAGINFFDTANVYSDGSSEEILGSAIGSLTRRENVVLATKVYGRTRPGPNGQGLSRKHIFAEIDASLKRLGTDYVDLYQIHRWDDSTPIEETLEALNDVVRAGKALHIGASSMYAWQFATALGLQRQHGWARFVSMQNHYNLIYREEEREMLPLCEAEGIGVLPWSPLARGKLTREWGTTSARESSDLGLQQYYSYNDEADRRVADALQQIAARRGLPRAQVALAWVLHNKAVTSPIIGVTKPYQLDDAVAALAIELEPHEIAALEAPYIPHPFMLLEAGKRPEATGGAPT